MCKIVSRVILFCFALLIFKASHAQANSEWSATADKTQKEEANNEDANKQAINNVRVYNETTTDEGTTDEGVANERVKNEGAKNEDVNDNKLCEEGVGKLENIKKTNDRKKPIAFLPTLQVRPRFEGHSLENNYNINQRTRVGFFFDSKTVQAKALVQDVRTWGSELNTLKDFQADNMDFHEGWLQLGNDDLFLRLGRQELALDGQRLIGAVGWTQQGRSFDSLRFGSSLGGTNATFFLSRINDNDRHDLALVHTAWKLFGLRLALPLIAQSNRATDPALRTNPDDWDRFTGGFHAKSLKGPLNWRVEAYAQQGTNHFAYMSGARLGYDINSALKPTLWVDFLSGDSDHTDSQTGTFDTLFATNHKFYGYFDKFLALPSHTQTGGLIDIALKNKGQLGPGALEIAAHYFLRATEGSDSISGAIAAEVDTVYVWKVAEHTKFVTGFALWLPQGELLNNDATKELNTWAFAMLDVNLSHP